MAYTFVRSEQGEAAIDDTDDVAFGTRGDTTTRSDAPVGIEEQVLITPVERLRICTTPNPFSKLMTISFNTEYDTKSIELKIYDATGRAVKEFNHLIHNQISWNGTDDLNRQLPSGVYFLKLQAGDYTTTEKLLLIR